MGRRLTVCSLAAVLVTALAGAEERLAVLEFFGRPNGAYCSAAGPAMLLLQWELAGRAVLLEYDFDAFRSGRVDRFLAADSTAAYLPLVMVGSGYRTSSGQTQYESVYRAMVEAELARPPQAQLEAYWRRAGQSLRVYVTVTNLGSAPVVEADQPQLWVVGWENARIGVSSTWVRVTASQRLADELDPGESLRTVVDTGAVGSVDWQRMNVLVLVERRLGAAARWDLLQAVEAAPAALAVSAERLFLGPHRPTTELTLDGPHVMTWSATGGVPWLELSATDGSLPATLTVTLVPELRPPTELSSRIVVVATGDGMSFERTVEVAVAGSVRRGGGRLRPDAR